MARGQGTYREWENWNGRTQREREHKSTNGGKYNPNNMGCFINSTQRTEECQNQTQSLDITFKKLLGE